MAEALDHIRAALAERYDVQRELGSGGMATVYLARDLKHDRRVAIKVLRSDLAAAVGSDRFLREIRITAQLNHPHILPLLDSGESDGLLFYAMPYVAGGSLRRLVGRETPLPLEVALRITQEVAAALDHAHRHGVIHRDVKPENILFSEGLAVVADFGIARAVGSAGRETLTRTGVPLGTPGYMSPEQATVTAVLDGRTDVFSLACVAYEMLIGETPAMWSTPEEVRLGRFLEPLPRHREILDVLPGRIEQALVKALAMRPADRFDTPVEFAGALAAAADRSATFSDAQVRAIIKRAAELQAEHPTEEVALSIGAVEQIAAEVGIPPDRVRQAIRELGPRAAPPQPAPPRPVSAAVGGGAVFYSSDNRLVLDRMIEGELPESEFAAAEEEIQATFGSVGQASIRSGSLVWSPEASGVSDRDVVVTITPEAGRTRIHIEERLSLYGGKMLGPTLGAAAGGFFGLLLAVALGEQDWYMVIPGVVLAFWGGFLTYYSTLWADAKRHKPEVEKLADRLTALVQRTARPALGRGVGPG